MLLFYRLLQYDHWRYTFPAEDTTQIWAKVPSQALSDALVEAMKDKLVDCPIYNKKPVLTSDLYGLKC